MKKSLSLLGAAKALSLVSVLAISSCNNGTKEVDEKSKEVVKSATEDKPGLEEKSSKDSTGEEKKIEIPKNIPYIKATYSTTRLMDWGKRPTSEEGFIGWILPSVACSGPSNVKASSTLAPQGAYNYKTENLSDDNPTTAWVEGSPDQGEGQYIELTNFFPMGDGTVSILNGLQFSKTIWESNSRVKIFKVSSGTKDLFVLELGDVMGVQQFKFPRELLKQGNGAIRFTILEVYPGSKWKDTAISEIFSCGG
jgi:hypothetical protein